MEQKASFIYPGLVFTMICWGLTFVVFKFAFESFQPVSIIFIRLFISSILLFLISGLMKKFHVIKKRDLKYFVILAFFEPFLYFMGESFGLTYVSPTLAAVIISLIPLIVPVVAWIFYREKLSLMNTAGLIISFFGVMLVVLSNGLDLSATLKGILLMFVAVIAAVGYSVTVKRLTLSYNGFTITFFQNAIGTFMFLPFFLIFDLNGFNVTPSLHSILAVLYLAVFGSSVTFVLFTMAIREIGIAKANIFTNLIPVITAVASWLLINEPMPFLKITGIAVVLAGLIMSQVKSVKLRKQKFPPAHYQYPA